MFFSYSDQTEGETDGVAVGDVDVVGEVLVLVVGEVDVVGETLVFAEGDGDFTVVNVGEGEAVVPFL